MRTILNRSLCKGAMWASVLGVAFTIMALGHTDPTTFASDGDSYAAHLAQRHDCGHVPEGDIPVGVVMTLRSWSYARYTEDPALVGAALDHAVGGVVNDVWSVEDFC